MFETYFRLEAFMGALTFRNRLGELVDIEPVSATKFKNEFGPVLDQAIRQGAVAITRHDATRAVLIAMDEFESLVAERSHRLDVLSGEFDGLLAKMQTSAARKGMADAFSASPAALGRAAVKAAVAK